MELLDRAEPIARGQGTDVDLQRSVLLARMGQPERALRLLQDRKDLSGAARLQRGRLYDSVGRFGDAWKDAVILVQIALLAGLRAPASAFYSGVLRGAGRPDYAFLLAVVGLVAIIVLVPAAARAGVVYVALAMAIQQAVDWAVGATLVRRLTGFSMRQQLLAGSGPLLAALAMGATVLLLSRPLAGAMPTLAAMAVLVAIGMAVYIGLLFVVVKDPVGKLRAGLALFRKAPKSAVA